MGVDEAVIMRLQQLHGGHLNKKQTMHGTFPKTITQWVATEFATEKNGDRTTKTAIFVHAAHGRW